MSVAELFTAVLESPSEELRLELARRAIRSPDDVLAEIAKRVGGDTVPDTVVVRTSVEVVLAALAYAKAEGGRIPVRVIAPQEPVVGWQPLRLLLDDYQQRGLVHVYETPMKPTVRAPARQLASRAARIAKGFSARTVDVTDSPPFIVAGLYSAGVRQLTILAYIESTKTAVFQRFSYTVPTR